MAKQPADQAAQTIDQLKTRYERLNEQKIKAQTNLQNARDELERLKAKAKQDYGSDDLAELQALLDDRKRNNEEARAAYQASLDQIESKLTEIDEKYRSAV